MRHRHTGFFLAVISLVAVGMVSACGGSDATTAPAAATTQPEKDGDMPTNGTKKDLVVTRVIDAPVERVWRAWIEPEHVKQWWGPNGFTTPVARMDVRVGGVSLVAMRSPQGQDIYTTWEYREIQPMRRLEFVLNFADQDGRRIDPTAAGLSAEAPQDVRHVITFTGISDARTEMTVTEFGYTSDKELDVSKAGLEQSLDKLATSLVEP